MSYENLKETLLTSQQIFDGRVLHLYHDQVRLPDGQTADRELIRHVGAVCIIPVTHDGRVVMERQYRYPVDEVIFEIPAGKLNCREEDPEAAARRELEEETGYTAGELICLGKYYPACAYCDETIWMYLARDLKKGARHLDEDEFLDVELVPLTELVQQVVSGAIPDAKTQMAVLRAAIHLGILK